jgi:hypothetical protein
MPFIPDAPSPSAGRFVPDPPAPVVDPREAGVPGSAAQIAAQPHYQEPSLGQKIHGAVEAGLNTARGILSSFPALAGGAAGFVQGIAHNMNVALTPGPLPPGATGMVNPSQTAEEGFNQAGSAVNRALAEGAGPFPGLSIKSTPTGEDYTQQIAESEPIKKWLPAISGLFPAGLPGMEPAMQAGGDALSAAAAPAAQAAGRVAAKVAPAAKAAGNAVADTAAAGLAKVLPKPDEGLAATAALADQFPHKMTIPPDRVLPEGAAKTVASNVGQAAGGGATAIDHQNTLAFNQNLIHVIDPTSSATRMTSTALSQMMKTNGEGAAKIMAGVQLPAEDVMAVAGPLAKEAAAKGVDGAERVIPNYVQDLQDHINADGTIDGSYFRDWNTAINEDLRSSGNSNVVSRLSDLQDAVQEVAENAIPDAAQRQQYQNFNRGYAYGMMLVKSGDVGKSVDGLIQPGRLIDIVNRTQVGKRFMALDNGGPIGDLAKVGKLIASPPHDLTHSVAQVAGLGAVDLLAGAHTAGATALGRVAASRAYNAVGGRATQRMIGGAPAAAPAAEPELMLRPYDAPTAGAPAAPGPGPLGDLTPDWETAPGAGGAPKPEGVDALDAFLENQRRVQPNGPPGGEELGAVARGAGSQIPAVPGRPDLPDAMVTGAPHEVAADEASNAAMHTPGAVEARQQQSAPAPAAPAPAPKPGPKLTPDEQAKADEIHAALQGTQSPIVRDALEKSHARVLKDAKNRETTEKAKAAADEIRTAAMGMADPTTRQELMNRADLLDPPERPPVGEVKEGQPPIAGAAAPTKPLPTGTATEGQPDLTPAAPAKPIPTGQATYVNTDEVLRQFGLGQEHVEQLHQIRAADDVDAAATEAILAGRHYTPDVAKRLREVQLGEHHATQGIGAAESGPGAQAVGVGGAERVDRPVLENGRWVIRGPSKADQAAGGQAAGGAEGNAGATGETTGSAQGGAQARSQGGAAHEAAGQQSQAGAGAGQRGQPADAVVDAAARARFEVHHPRGSDGRFHNNAAAKGAEADDQEPKP